MTIETEGITYEMVSELIARLPDDVEITFVGGQALLFWVQAYSEEYADHFAQREDIVFGTNDIDLVAKSEVVERCARAWNAKIARPEPDDVTPNIAIVSLNVDGVGEVLIDFLNDYLRPQRMKARYQDRVQLSERKQIYVLSPFSVLLSKMANVLILRRHHEHALGQLRASLIITRCYISQLLGEGGVKEAQHLITAILLAADKARLGKVLWDDHQIDLLDALPKSLEGLDDRFISHNIKHPIGVISAARAARAVRDPKGGIRYPPR